MILQSHHFSVLESVIVAPVHRASARPMQSLDLTIQVAGETLVVGMAELAAVMRSGVGTEVLDATELEDDFRRALDRLFTGF